MFFTFYTFCSDELIYFSHISFSWLLLDLCEGPSLTGMSCCSVSERLSQKGAVLLQIQSFQRQPAPHLCICSLQMFNMWTLSSKRCCQLTSKMSPDAAELHRWNQGRKICSLELPDWLITVLSSHSCHLTDD